MSDEALYEHYKNALRSGHIAAVRGRTEAALTAYAQAAAVAPDRPLPHTSAGRVLMQAGRLDEALVAYGEALRRAPRDEAALVGRADGLISAGRPAEAAGVLDLLADTQEAAGRVPDACDTARRALELAESRARRRQLERLTAALRASLTERGASETLERALRTLEVPVAAVARPAGVGPEDSGPGRADAGVLDPNRQPLGPSVMEPPPPEVLDLSSMTAAVAAAIEGRDTTRVHEVILETAAKLRRAGLLDAAIDACQLGLTVAPADPDLHLALAELDIDHGWRDVAADKLAILGRFVELSADQVARERLCAIISANFPDDPRLAAVCS